MTSSNGSIQAQYDFEPFGTAAKIQESTAADFQYASYFQHARTSNSLPVYRTYSPSLGRWLSRDPLMESGGINLYAYVDNNPVSVRDPLGLVGSPRRPSKKPCCKNPPLPPLPGPNGGPPEDCYKFCTSNTHSCYYWCLRNCEDPQDYLDCIRACNKWLEECLKRCREQ
ncbi:MAG: RHS repeat domain-containing protein [Candidatus Obscuribacterales bacterium]